MNYEDHFNSFDDELPLEYNLIKEGNVVSLAAQNEFPLLSAHPLVVQSTPKIEHLPVVIPTITPKIEPKQERFLQSRNLDLGELFVGDNLKIILIFLVAILICMQIKLAMSIESLKYKSVPIFISRHVEN